MSIVVLGASGQLGQDLLAEFQRAGAPAVGLAHAQVEVADAAAVDAALDPLAPRMIINTTAMHNVDKCEQDPQRSFAVNGLGAWNVARAARRLGAGLIHISTDYVFDGRKTAPYVETDLPGPLNAYGNTKLSGEHFVLTTWSRALVLRVSGLYGRHPCRAKQGLNFVELMLKLGRERGKVRVIATEFVSPTATADLARQIRLLCEKPLSGLAHATAEGQCSWYEFACAIFKEAGLAVDVQRADPGEFPAKVPRPAYSVLENQVLKQAGLNILRPWQEALREYLAGRPA